MAMMLELHDRMLTELHERNLQLAQEKAEVELRLKQALSLLSELQSVWMDLPPQVAESINRMLVRQAGGVPPPRKKAAAAAAAALEPPHWNWLGGLGGGGWFGSAPEPDANAKGSPASKAKKPASGRVLLGCGPRARQKQAERGAFCGAMNRPILAPAERTSGSRTTSADEFTDIVGGVPVALGAEAPDTPRHRTPVYNLAEAPETPRLSVRAQAQARGVSVEELDHIIEDVPGAPSLVAEIDNVCTTLQQGSRTVFADLRERLESLEEELLGRDAALDEALAKQQEAHAADIQLCRLEVRFFPAMKGARMTDATRCQEALECRLQAARAHKDWLKALRRQRLQSALRVIDLREKDSKKDFNVLWQRRCALVAKLRASFAESEDRLAVEEAARVRRDLEDIQGRCLQPISDVAAAEQEERAACLALLREACGATRDEEERAMGFLDVLVERGRHELRARTAQAVADNFANERVQQRALLALPFYMWLVAGSRRLRDESTDLAAALSDARRRMERAELSRCRSSGFVTERHLTLSLLGTALGCWVGAWLRSKHQKAHAVKGALEHFSGSLEEQGRNLQKALTRARTGSESLARWLCGSSRESYCLEQAFSAWHMTRLRGKLANAEKSQESLSRALDRAKLSWEASTHLAVGRTWQNLLLSQVLTAWRVAQLQRGRAEGPGCFFGGVAAWGEEVVAALTT